MLNFKQMAEYLLNLSRRTNANDLPRELKHKNNIIKLVDTYKSDREMHGKPLFYTYKMRNGHRWDIEQSIKQTLPMLFEYFQIDASQPDCWQKLALCLAHEHINAFKIQVDKGRPNTQSVSTLSRLYRYYNDFREGNIDGKDRSNKSQAHLCRLLLKSPEFREKFPELKGNNCSSSLENLVGKARSMYETRRAWEAKESARNSDEEPLEFSSNPPPWDYGYKAPLYLKYGASDDTEEES